MDRYKSLQALEGYYYYHLDLLPSMKKLVGVRNIFQQSKVYSRKGQPVTEKTVTSPYDQYAFGETKVEQAANGLTSLAVGLNMVCLNHAVPYVSRLQLVWLALLRSGLSCPTEKTDFDAD